MSILIKGMEMPKSCDVCRFAIDGFCYASGKANVSAVEDRQVTNYCPLVPVPPHGRLIDADKLGELCDIMAEKCDGIGASIWHQFKTTVEWSPIVIPAEEGE